mmetsp:Transcript_64650/g.173200  ORF Transcript_64650/g.173200 Transcript_64650/m.173200 type:complete len:202 (-) Transcript_64650:465-1070(-)
MALVAGLGEVGSLRWNPMRSRNLLPNSILSCFTRFCSSVSAGAVAGAASGSLIPIAARRSALSFSSSAFTRARSRASRSRSRCCFSSANFSSCSRCLRNASFISLLDWMRASSCCLARSASFFFLSRRICSSRSSSSRACSSLDSLGFLSSSAPPASTMSGSSTVGSSPCSPSQLTAPSSEPPPSQMPLAARSRGNPISVN